MTGITKDSGIYGKALYELACEENVSTQMLKELHTVCKIFDASPEYMTFLDFPSLKTEERLTAIKEDFNSFSEYIVNFLCILAEKRIVSTFHSAAEEFEKLYDKDNGILKVTAVSAVPLTEEQISAIASKLRLKVEGTKQVIITNKTDPSILGGLILRYAGKQEDASLSLQLKTIRDKIWEA